MSYGFVNPCKSNLEEAYKELYSFSLLLEQLTSSKDIGELNAKLLEISSQIVPIKGGLILDYNEKTDEFVQGHVMGQPAWNPEMIINEDKTKFLKWVLSQTKTILDPEALKGYIEIFVPLKASNLLFGILVLESSLSGDYITQQHLTLLNLLGQHASIALANSRLMNELQEKNLILSNVLEELEASYNELSNWNINLDELVKKKTEDLRAANSRLQSQHKELMESHKKLEVANLKLQKLDRIRTEFFSNLSHELKTPLNAIIGFSELLIDRLHGPLNIKQEESLEKILKNGKHLLNLINDILDLSRLESGITTLKRQLIEIMPFFRIVVSLLEPLINDKHISMTLNVEENVETVWADPDRFKQILDNLLSNAIKFTPENKSIKLDAAFQKESPNNVLLSVTDPGQGITQTDQATIFQRFNQAKRLNEPRVKGTGLGLNITKKLVELHGGKIWVKSPSPELKGKIGTTFYFTLPAIESSGIA